MYIPTTLVRQSLRCFRWPDNRTLHNLGHFCDALRDAAQLTFAWLFELRDLALYS